MNEKRNIGCLETFKPSRRENLAGSKTVHHFDYTFKDGIDPDLAEQAARGLAIAFALGRVA